MAVCKRRRSKLGSTAAQFQILLCCLFLTILQVATVSGQQTLLPSITQHPVGGIFAQDSTVELNCEASSGHGDETPPTYQWVRDNTLLGGDGGVTISGNSLVIQSLNVETSGSYACLATSNLGTVISAAAEVQLITLDPNVLSNSESSPHLTSVVAGIPDSISCSSPPATGIPSPETVWKVMLGNSYLDIAGSPNTLPGIDGRLYFLQPSEDNARLYRCEVTAVTASDNLDTFGYIELSVTDNSGAPSAPVFLLEPQDTTVNVGDNAYFQCIVGGDPLPETIEWFIDTQDTESTLKRVLYFDDRSRVLVSGVDSMDVGTYTCAAASLENSSATLTVRGIPEITTQTPESQSVEYGQAVSLACQLDPSSLDVSFRWFHNGELLPSETGPALTTLDAAELSDGGVYQCFAVNPAGSTSIAFHISVITIDTAFTEGGELTDQLAFIGLPFVMHCSATGAPPPTYTWYKSGVPLSESETLSFPDGTLTILDVTDSHAGLYTCEAQNMLPETGVVIHTVSSSAELTVIAATTLVESIENPFTIQLGGNTELPCVASSESGAELTYTWTKDGAPLEVGGSNHRVQWVEEGGGGGSGSLRIIMVMNGDAGTYQCTVETVYGGLSAQPVASELSKVSLEAGPVKPLVTGVEALNSTAIMVLWLFQADSTNLLQFTVQTKRFGEEFQEEEEGWLDGASTNPQAITQAAVHGLSPFTKYSVRVLSVYADSSVGVSDSSMEVSTLEAPPTMPPSGLMAAVTEDNMGLNLFWEAPQVGGRNGLLVDYTVQFYQVDDNKTLSERSVGGNATNYLLTGLAPLTEYSVRVAANTSVGMGPYSDSITIKTDDGVREPTPTPPYITIWFIAVMIAIGVLIALIAFIVMLLVIWNCRKCKQKINRVRGGQRGNTDDISLREDVVASTEVLTGRRLHPKGANDTQVGEQEEVFVSSGHCTTGVANEGWKVEDDELTTAMLDDEGYTVPHFEERDQITDMAKLEMQQKRASQYTKLNKKTLDAPAEYMYTVPPKKETNTEAQLQGLSTQYYNVVPSKEARVKPTEPEPLQKPLRLLYTELRKETLEPSEQYTELEVNAKTKLKRHVEVEYVISEKDELTLHAQPSANGKQTKPRIQETEAELIMIGAQHSTEAQLQGLSTQYYNVVPSKEARVKPTEPEPLQKPLRLLYTELRKETLEPSEQYTELEVNAKTKLKRDVEVEYVISKKDELALHVQPSANGEQTKPRIQETEAELIMIGAQQSTKGASVHRYRHFSF